VCQYVGAGFPPGMVMMRERAARGVGTGSATRTTVAVLAAVALLLQLLVMPPLAMRMMGSHASTGRSVALCTSGSGEQASSPANQPRQPASTHDHNTCPLCQSHPVPLALLAVAIALLAATTRWRRLGQLTLALPAPAWPFRLYSSRAPPALA
jgi:Protein of unknown function (DUF2946)